jgi:hypothetical protein
MPHMGVFGLKNQTAIVPVNMTRTAAREPWFVIQMPTKSDAKENEKVKTGCVLK